jgi:hypothetical protein
VSGAFGFTGLLVFVCVAAGCGASLEQLRNREDCYFRAESDAQVRVDLECKDGFAACASKDDIMAQLKAAQEACK